MGKGGGVAFSRFPSRHRRIGAATAAAMLAAGLALAPGTPARANDSSAELAAGGLRLTHNADIRIEAEDLHVSRRQIRVSYVFRNLSDQPQTVLVAFPLPEIDMAELGDGDVGIISADPVNFVDFTVSVDGVSVQPEVAERASLFGLDVSDTLNRAGLPLNPMADGVWQQILALPETTQKELVEDGLVIVDGDYAQPLWRYGVVFYWRQTFPPGRPVRIEHSYAPVAGASVWYEEFFTEPAQARQFCIEPSFAQAAVRKARAMGDTYPTIHWVSYILTTGANWAGTIDDFRLTVDKGTPESLVSLCRDGIKKTGPSTFEWRAEDYWPDQDLKVLFVE
ncbi:MAG: DUF4424 domain-containing protein [Hyphomicrobiales bacterium]|nr:DUF4424 domain-containing protein [Hyphomicrobiales bacterium]